MLAALLLPLALVILGLAPRLPSLVGQGGRAAGASAQEASRPAHGEILEALRASLERAAEQHLASPKLEDARGQWRVVAPDPARAARHVADFARELGGSTVEAGDGRLLIVLPEANAAEFVRRVAVMTGAEPPEAGLAQPFAMEFVPQSGVGGR